MKTHYPCICWTWTPAHCIGLAVAGPHHREPADARGGWARAARRQRALEARNARGGARAALSPCARARDKRRAPLHACALREQVRVYVRSINVHKDFICLCCSNQKIRSPKIRAMNLCSERKCRLTNFSMLSQRATRWALEGRREETTGEATAELPAGAPGEPTAKAIFHTRAKWRECTHFAGLSISLQFFCFPKIEKFANSFSVNVYFAGLHIVL